MRRSGLLVPTTSQMLVSVSRTVKPTPRLLTIGTDSGSSASAFNPLVSNIILDIAPLSPTVFRRRVLSGAFLRLC
jgi:hypothetical protein